MNVLYIDEELPFPCTTGKKTRTWNLLTRLAQSHSITYVAYIDPGAHRDTISRLQHMGVRVVPIVPRNASRSRLHFYLALLRNLFSKYPYIVAGHYTPRMQKRIDELLRAHSFDLVHCEISPYALFLRKIRDIPKVVVAHNVESEIWKGYYSFEGNLLKKAYLYLQYRKVLSFEALSLREFTTCITMSRRDMELFRNKGWNRSPAVVDNGVDTNFFRSRQVPWRRGNLVFTGSMDWRPNQDGILYFVNEIFPLIYARESSATCTIVGCAPPAAITALPGKIKGIEVTGTVPDVRPYINEAQVYVVPLRIGGGTRLKILEAMAMGKPIVATRLAAEGLEIEHGRHFLRADSPEEFATAVLNLFNDPDFASALGARARARVEQRYSWDRLATEHEQLWRESVRTAAMRSEPNYTRE